VRRLPRHAATRADARAPRRADSLPSGDYLYEPKRDGFRCLAFRQDGQVDLRSRTDRPLAHYFPELVD